METGLETVVKEGKPSFMQRTRDFMKKKWVNLGLGAIVAGSMLMGSANNLSAQTSAQEENYNEPPRQEEVYDVRNIRPDSSNQIFQAYVIQEDQTYDNDLAFIAEDMSRTTPDGKPLKILVINNYNQSNANIIDEIQKRINNPEQYPWFEMTGKVMRASPYSVGDWNVMLKLKQMTIYDQEGNKTLFPITDTTDTSDSEVYNVYEPNDYDWMYAPGSCITGFYYPRFGIGFAPWWDLDMDGIPNWMDPDPLWPNYWDPFMFAPWHHHNWHWHPNWWAGSPYWGYWGDGDRHWKRHRDHDNDKDFQNIIHKIGKNQLQDPRNRDEVRKYIRGINDSRDLRKIMNPDQLKNLEQVRKGIFDRDYEFQRKNSNIIIHDKDGSERIIRSTMPEKNLEYRITSPGIMREHDKITTRDSGSTERSIRHYEPKATNPKAQEPKKGTVIKKDNKDNNKASSSNSGPVKKKKEYERSYSLSPRSEYNIRESPANSQTQRTMFPSRLSNNQSEVSRYSWPRINYDRTKSNSSRSYFSPSRSTISYSRPSVSRSSTSKSSGSYRSSGSNYSRGSSSSNSSHSSHSSSGSIRRR